MADVAGLAEYSYQGWRNDVAESVRRGDPPPRLRLRVNPIRCTAFGFCGEYCPELFALDDWGYAWPRGRDVPAGHEALAIEAARLCPTNAIVLETIPPTAPAAPAPGASSKAGAKTRPGATVSSGTTPTWMSVGERNATQRRAPTRKE